MEFKKYDNMYFEVMEKYGLYLPEVNALVAWKDVDLQKLTKETNL